MPALSEYSNVYNTALLILKAKGYQTWYDEQSEVFGAEKEGWDFLSDSPCGLLGLIAIHEHRQPEEYREYWWRIEGEDLYGQLPSRPQPYSAVIHDRLSKGP